MEHFKRVVYSGRFYESSRRPVAGLKD